jgi:chorismate mutase
LIHCYTERSRGELQHVFLEGAAALRQDLAPRDDAPTDTAK